jgi:CheY-like chemotaxis protein
MDIIVLDDSLTIQLTISAMLEDLGVEEDHVHLFTKGQDALDYIEKNGADIIFTDIQMPEMTGYEFVQKLIAISERYVSKLFVTSGDDDGECTRRMKDIGAKRFIPKPISLERFNHFVKPELAKYHLKK